METQNQEQVALKVYIASVVLISIATNGWTQEPMFVIAKDEKTAEAQADKALLTQINMDRAERGEEPFTKDNVSIKVKVRELPLESLIDAASIINSPQTMQTTEGV